MLPARGDGGLHRPGATAGQTTKARTAAGPGRRRQHRPRATAAHTHRHSPYHAATFAGARGTRSSTLPQARTVSVAACPSTPPISDALIPPPTTTSFPTPRSRRRRRRHRFPAALATTGAGAATATGPEPAPPTTGGSGGRIWGRGNKKTVAYPVPEQDMQKRVKSSRRRDDPDQPRTGSNNQQDKCQDKRNKIAG